MSMCVCFFFFFIHVGGYIDIGREIKETINHMRERERKREGEKDRVCIDF